MDTLVEFSRVIYPSHADCEHIVCPRHSTVCHYPKDDQRSGMACICLAHSNHLSFRHISQTVKSVSLASQTDRMHTKTKPRRAFLQLILEIDVCVQISID